MDMSEFGEFTCDCCKETFPREAPETEAIEEYLESFSERTDEPICVTCDDCYQKIGEFYNWEWLNGGDTHND